MIAIQRESRLRHIPSDSFILKCLDTALEKKPYTDITLRIVNRSESAILNKTYRQKTGATNILAFSYTLKPICGDIVLCAPLIKGEANWAHLMIHGLLHLRGYDHYTPPEAAKMEKHEAVLLKKIGFENPYA